ncbi:MAG: Trm112 family protein [Spirochaetes bacterium]|nr:Trm112 family protein [Spirochaetota bacterium]
MTGKKKNKITFSHHDLSKILACPSCHGTLSFSRNLLVCSQCKIKYPIKDGVPIMLVKESKY